MSTGLCVDIKGFVLAKVIAVLFIALLVLRDKGFPRKTANAFAVPESSYKIHPLLAVSQLLEGLKTGGLHPERLYPTKK